ncbi:MAG TPA: DUF2786 domain-containing protein [Candidatus Binataceae bacterium]|nr:DUF2786 domain-containing protein [Candidatus Binataceae bacterium]
MNRQEALRKIALLRQMTLDNGASASEAAAAAKLAQDLMSRYVGEPKKVEPPRSVQVAVKAQEVPTEPWARLLDEFGYQLKTFNGRCSAGLSRTSRLLIRAEDQRWEVQESSLTGWRTTTRGIGFHSLRDFLTRNTARRYTFTH